MKSIKTEGTQKIRVFVIEENRLIGEGLRFLFNDMPHFDSIFAFSDPLSCMDRIAQFTPDVLLFRYSNSISQLEDFLRQLHLCSPTTKPILHDTSLADNLLQKLVHQGIRGILQLDADAVMLQTAIQCLAKGEFWINRKITARLLSSTLENTNAAQGVQKKNIYDLTAREKEVLSLLTKGLKNSDIARQLFISDTTVKCHLNRIFKKIGVNNRYEAIVYSLNSCNNGNFAEIALADKRMEEVS